jgi:predicted negative regulator of RcsB-dependent stress response
MKKNKTPTKLTRDEKMNELLELDEATIVSTIKNVDKAKNILKTRHDIEELLRFENELR